MNHIRCLKPGPHVIGQPLIQGYLASWLGPKTFGRVLNVGAGDASVQYDYARRLNNASYETLEISGSTSPTYVGDVCNMPAVPSETFDWVLAVAVLEHVKDMQAAVSEIHRVLKPGGLAYISIPLHNDIHFGTDFGDYWRVTPFGFRELLAQRFSIQATEYWGDCFVDPVAIAVIAQKDAADGATVEHLFYVEGGLQTIDKLIDGAAPFRFTMPVLRSKMNTIEYIRQVRQWRIDQFLQNGSSVSIREADRLLVSQAVEREGTIVIENDCSRFVPG